MGWDGLGGVDSALESGRMYRKIRVGGWEILILGCSRVMFGVVMLFAKLWVDVRLEMCFLIGVFLLLLGWLYGRAYRREGLFFEFAKHSNNPASGIRLQ